MQNQKLLPNSLHNHFVSVIQSLEAPVPHHELQGMMIRMLLVRPADLLCVAFRHVFLTPESLLLTSSTIERLRSKGHPKEDVKDLATLALINLLGTRAAVTCSYLFTILAFILLMANITAELPLVDALVAVLTLMAGIVLSPIAWGRSRNAKSQSKTGE